ncbi:MAG: heparinase II/III family protein [Myxococcota bacterium]
MAEIGRLLRTLAHLAPGQVWQRLRLSARRSVWSRCGDRIDARYRRAAEALPPPRFDHPGLARVAAFRTGHGVEALERTARDVSAGRFTFLNRERELGSDVAWHDPELDVGTRLWKTQLHEFPYAVALAFAHGRAPAAGHRERLFALIRSWTDASPIGRRGFALDAWNARAVATRLCHWAVAGSLLGLSPDEPCGRTLGREIGRHGLFLRDNLELDLLGNHLFRDAVGLVFADQVAGGVPDAIDQLERQVREQVLPDGCHVERAPMYHAVCLKDLLETHVLLGDTSPAWLADAVARMAGWLDALLLGDGDLPLLGDGWLGEVDVAALLAACRAAVGALPPPAEVERHGGLVPLAAGPLRAVLRAGPHGPDYMLGHAHADLLSFDLSDGRARVVTDTGTALYDPGPERQYLRSTAAHNTLQVDGEEQIEAWGSFRVGRRGRARVIGRGRHGGFDWVWAAHDAYAWLPGRPRHQRLLAVSEHAALVLDAVTGSGRHRIASRLHLHPDRPDTGNQMTALGSAAGRRSAPYHGHFGETREMTCVEVEASALLPWIGGWWIPCGPALRSDSEEIECDLHIREGRVELVLRGGSELTARWNLDGSGAPSDAVSFCPPDRQSAT